MPRSTILFFPDINVWLALTFRRHVHHAIARRWLNSETEADLFFCRLTQLGLLRLLSTTSIMGDQVCSQVAAWTIYDGWLESGRAMFLDEPPAIGQTFRVISSSGRPAPKDWTDSYLAAFAQTSGLRLVTFDRALGQKTQDSILLEL